MSSRTPAAANPAFENAVRHHKAGRLDEAERLYRQVHAFDPHYADSLHLLGVIGWQKGRYDAAVALIKKAIAITPKAAAFHSNLGLALKDQGKLEEAIACYRKAVALKPAFPEAHNNLGNILRDLGRFDEAIASFERALRYGGDPCFSFYELSRCRKFTQADRPLIAQMEATLKNPKFSKDSRAVLHFALGKIFDELSDYESAIRHFDEANRLERATVHCDPGQFAALVDWSISTFSKERILNSPVSSASELPIFIVGMPRSGTTLVEQILASHSKVCAGGELGFWLQRLDTLKMPRGGLFDPDVERNIIRDYLSLLTQIAPDAARVTDKMPYNFVALGLIRRLFPNARIVHCRRNPVDTALSIYFTRFSKRHEFTLDRAAIVKYYQKYRDQMEHWRQALPPERYLEIDYDRLVGDQETLTRTLVAFCGLDWEGACLDFQTTDRPINTASVWQARQPIYRTSVERWRHYEPWLGEFRELLPQTI